MSGRGRRRCRDRMRRLGRVRRLVRMCRGGTRRHGVELVLAAGLDARSGVRRRGPLTRVLGDARPVHRGRVRRGQVGRVCRTVSRGPSAGHVCRRRVGRGQVGRRRGCRGQVCRGRCRCRQVGRRRCCRRFRRGRGCRGQVCRGRSRCRQVGRRRCCRRFRRGRGCRGQVCRGRCCRGFRTVLVCDVEPSAVRLRARVLLRHGRLPPPARHDGGRPAAAGPRSAGRRRSMRTVATWDSNSSAPVPKQLRAARRPERWFCRDEPTTPLPSVCDLPGGRSAAAGRRGRAHRDGQVRPRRRARLGPGRGGRQRGRDGPLPGDGRRHGQARPRRARRCSAPPARCPGRHRDRLRRGLPAGGAGGRRGPARRRSHAGAGRGLGVVRAGGGGRAGVPGHGSGAARGAGGGAGHRRTGGTAHPPGRRRRRRRGGGAAQQRAPDRAGAGGRGAHRPPVPGSARDGRPAAVRRGAARRGPPDGRARRAGRPPRRPHVRVRPGRGDPRAARPRPARGPHRLPGARLPAGRRRARRLRPLLAGDLGAAAADTVRATRRFVRRQRSWFRRDRRIRWLDPGPDLLGRALRTLGP